ncbi:MAG TPA: universal stress protein [Nocardioides sp.]|nr:universal stress protein [Nocardioides sp.]
MVRHEIPSGNVVVGVDGSSRGLAGVRFAAHEAARAGVGLQIVSVAPGYVPVGPLPMIPDDSLQSYGRHALVDAAAAARAEVPTLEVGAHLLTGGRVEELVRVGSEAVLVVLAGRDLDRMDRVLTGATVPGVASRATCPVVVLPPAWEPTGTAYGRIVVGLKNLGHAAELLEDGFARAEELGAELHVLHAWRLGGRYDELVTGTGEEQRWAADRVAELETHLDSPRDRHPGVVAKVRVVHARPATALVDASHEADRLLVTRPAHGGFVHHLGSTGRTVLRSACCPVEVRPPGC